MIPDYHTFMTDWVIRIDPADLKEYCTICTDDPFTAPVKIPCGHVYDLHCLVEWLKESKKCPLCRRELFNNGTEQTLGASQRRLELDGDARSEVLARRLDKEGDEQEGDPLFMGHGPHDGRAWAPGHSFPAPAHSEAYNDYDGVSQAIRSAMGPGNAHPFPAPVASSSSFNRFGRAGNAFFPTQGGGPSSAFQDPELSRVFQNQANSDRNPRGRVNRDLELLEIHPGFVFGHEREVLERRAAMREANRHQFSPKWSRVSDAIAHDPFGAEAIGRIAQLEWLAYKSYSPADGVYMETHNQSCALHIFQFGESKVCQKSRVNIESVAFPSVSSPIALSAINHILSAAM